MTETGRDAENAEAADPVVTPPEPTGDPEIDAALAGLDGLVDRPVTEHHDRLAQAHETLHAALDRGESAP